MQLLEHIRNWYSFGTAIGVSASLDMTRGMQLVHIKRSPEGLSVFHMQHMPTVDALRDYSVAHRTEPVALLLQGKGVLLKTVPKGQLTDNPEAAIQQVFPAYTAQDFYLSVHHGAEQSWVALVRREPLDALVHSLLDAGVNLVQIAVGPFVLDGILQQLNVYNRMYVFDGHRIEVNAEGDWLTYDYDVENRSKYKTKVGTKHIEQEFLPAYAMAFHMLMGDWVTDFSIAQDDLIYRLDEAKERIKFKNNSLLVLGAVFLLLLISTVLYSSYTNENQLLEGQVGSQQLSGREVKEQTKKTVRYEQLLKELGWNGGISKAWLLDQLGRSLDKHGAIQLTGIQINPAPERKRGGKEKVADRRNVMVLTGRCVSLDGLNAWGRTLDHLAWVQHQHMVRFGKSQAYGDDKHIFQLEIGFGYEGDGPENRDTGDDGEIAGD